VGDIFNDAVSS